MWHEFLTRPHNITRLCADTHLFALSLSFAYSLTLVSHSRPLSHCLYHPLFHPHTVSFRSHLLIHSLSLSHSHPLVHSLYRTPFFIYSPHSCTLTLSLFHSPTHLSAHSPSFTHSHPTYLPFPAEKTKSEHYRKQHFFDSKGF
jgi:hypothetical protein